jgi:hypothetical protein
MGERDAGVRYLPVTGFTAQLLDRLDGLRDPGSAEWMSM